MSTRAKEIGKHLHYTAICSLVDSGRQPPYRQCEEILKRRDYTFNIQLRGNMSAWKLPVQVVLERRGD